MRGQTSAADGFNKALETVRHDLVVFVQQDMYLPRGWDSQFLAQFRDAERQLGPVGVAGVFGYRFGPDGKDNLGRVLDRQALHDARAPLPATADGLDEIVLAVPRATPLRFDPGLGFHLYGADICLSARQQGLPVVVLDAPCLHNSLFMYLSPEFHRAREQVLAKWPDVRPLHSSWADDLRERSARLEGELAGVRAELDDRRRHIANMEASMFWRLRSLTHRALRR
jgi:hypothetical protein